jgi:hypothetical protein
MNRLLPPPVSDHLDLALEALCATLITLEVIKASAPRDDPLRTHAARATQSLRRAAAELRLASAAGAPQRLHEGFILPGDDLP